MKLFVTSYGVGCLAITNVISAPVTNWFLRDSESESEIPPALKVIIFEKKNPPPKQFDTVDGSEILRSPVDMGKISPLFTDIWYVWYISGGDGRISAINSRRHQASCSLKLQVQL